MQRNFTLFDETFAEVRVIFKFLGVALLCIHFYCYCFPVFERLGLTSSFVNKIALRFVQGAFPQNEFLLKVIALASLGLSSLKVSSRPAKGYQGLKTVYSLVVGAICYFFSFVIFRPWLSGVWLLYGYLVATLLGLFLILAGSKSIIANWVGQVSSSRFFNSDNETFPQEERCIANEYSVNLPAEYNLRGVKRTSWINIINPFRGLLVLGTPGSGKTRYIIRQVIRQHIQKGFALFVYDFKFPDLTVLAHHYLQEFQSSYPVAPRFYVIDFEYISHRCNPVNPSSLQDITDAAESARTILLALNPTWIVKQGDFWVESAINFLTAVLWWLRLYENGKYCTLAHLVELVQTPYEKLFSILRVEPQVEVLIMPFITAYLNNARAQLEGQVAGATISLSKLASPNMYYVLSGDDFRLDINNPDEPKIVCLGNNPQKAGVYGAVLALYITELARQLNKRNQLKSSLVFDEFPTIYFNGIDRLMATARSNRVATTLAIQDSSQLKLHYGREQAEVIINVVGNIVSGQVSGETARQLADRFGKIIQEKESVSTNENRHSLTQSTQLDMAIPQATISSLSAGEFVGIVADDPGQEIRLKKFHCRIVEGGGEAGSRMVRIPFEKLDEGTAQFPFKKFARGSVSKQEMLITYQQIKKEVREMVDSELSRLMKDPLLKGTMSESPPS